MTPTLSNDQTIRIQCLQICGGSVAEAKNAYFWVMNEGGSGVKSVAMQLGQQSLQDRQRAVQQQAVAAAELFNSSKEMNGRNPYIGGGSSD